MKNCVRSSIQFPTTFSHEPIIQYLKIFINFIVDANGTQAYNVKQKYLNGQPNVKLKNIIILVTC